MKIALYFDEDAQNTGLIQALGLRGIDAIGAWAVGMREQKDEEHLRKASALKRALYSFNVRDFAAYMLSFSLKADRTRASFSPNNNITRSVSR